MKKLNWLILCLIITAFTSCVNQKQVAYFQPDQPGAPESPIEIKEAYSPTIQQADILSIYVTSLNPEASLPFNPYLQVDRSQAQPQVGNQPGQLPNTYGYLVDTEGNVELPMVGKLQVGGLTTLQARNIIREKLTKYLKEPTVNVRFLNFKVSVMGEVARPSMFTIPNEKITLPEALSLAGDITIFGKRDNVLIIRETNGKREFARINLNKRDLFTSPYYYLHPNDIVYVEPNKVRAASADRTMQLTPIVLSALSFLAIIAAQF